MVKDRELVEKMDVKENGLLFIDEDRSIVTSTSAFGTLRQDLMKNIGKDRMRGFLNRYGWELGKEVAKKVLKKDWNSIHEKIQYGPFMHMLKGHAIVETTKLETDYNNGEISVLMEGTWEESYEAVEHVKQFGKAKEPICHTLTGYASGYLTKLCNQKVIFKEVSCQAQGNSKCKWVGKSLDYWQGEANDELEFYRNLPIVKELELTYEKLLEERNNLEKRSLVHQKLTEKILEGDDLQSIVETIYEVTNIPGIITDQYHYPLAYKGFSNEDIKEINEEFKTEIMKKENKKNNKAPISYQHTKKVELKNHTRLITPIYLEKEIIGYCSFIYLHSNIISQKSNEMMLEQIAVVSSLLLLIEKTKFDTDRRTKGHFLEEILRGEYNSEEEILRKGLFMKTDLSKPYRIITVKYQFKKPDNEKVPLFHENLFDETTHYFKNKPENIMIGQIGNKITFLVLEDEINEKKIRPYFNKYLRTLSSIFSSTLFVAGVSNLAESITSAKDYYKESLIPMRMGTANNRINFFDTIGMIGPLLNENNEDEIKRISQNMLGELLNKKDLLSTLYVFLSNGGNLEQTSIEVALSLSGLRYRLGRIEELLNHDLRDSFYNYQLFLSLQSLLLMGELELNID